MGENQVSPPSVRANEAAGRDINLSEPQFTFQENEGERVFATWNHRDKAIREGGKCLASILEIF